MNKAKKRKKGQEKCRPGWPHRGHWYKDVHEYNRKHDTDYYDEYDLKGYNYGVP